MLVQKTKMWLVAWVLSASFLMIVGGTLLATIDCPDKSIPNQPELCPGVVVGNPCVGRSEAGCNNNGDEVTKRYTKDWRTIDVTGYRADDQGEIPCYDWISCIWTTNGTCIQDVDHKGSTPKPWYNHVQCAPQ